MELKTPWENREFKVMWFTTDLDEAKRFAWQKFKKQFHINLNSPFEEINKMIRDI